ncbi:MAG TPA: methyltransferase domain-containing protein [Lacipirellula sp.]
MALPSLAERRFRPELMDEPGLDLAEHARALGGLRRLNVASATSRQLWSVIAEQTGVRPGGRLRLLDVASGGGDVALGLWRLAARCGVDLQILGLDKSSAACHQASKRCQPAGAAIAFQCTDVTTAALPKGFDVTTSTLFLHHLLWKDAVNVLAKMAAAGQLLVVNDLRRSTAGYAIAHVACRTFTRSKVVRFDGPQSVANAYTVEEARELCRLAGLIGALVRRSWPWRMTIVHNKPESPSLEGRG